jgi:hypothetical protein
MSAVMRPFTRLPADEGQGKAMEKRGRGLAM